MSDRELAAWTRWLTDRPCLDRVDCAVHDYYSLYLGRIYRIDRDDVTTFEFGR